MAPEEKKNILDQAINALTGRDDKAAAAAAAAAKAKAEADARAKAAADENAKAVAAANAKAAAEAKAKADADAKAQAEMDARAAAVAKANAEAAAYAAEKAKADAILTTHTVVAGETLSGIALKYYGHATPEYWNKIKDANKAMIDEHKGNIIAGQKLIIPKA